MRFLSEPLLPHGKPWAINLPISVLTQAAALTLFATRFLTLSVCQIELPESAKIISHFVTNWWRFGSMISFHSFGKPDYTMIMPETDTVSQIHQRQTRWLLYIVHFLIRETFQGEGSTQRVFYHAATFYDVSLISSVLKQCGHCSC